MEDICNGVADCPFQDDEYYCNSFQDPCPTNCTCLIFVIQCSNNDFVQGRLNYKHHLTHVKVTISNANLTNNELSFFEMFNQTISVKVHQSKVSDICLTLKKYKPKYYWRYLSLALNSLTYLSHRCFNKMPFFLFLNLSHNFISKLAESAFTSTGNLSVVDLSFNNITHLVKSMFKGDIKLKYINLQGNSIIHVSSNFFKGITFNKIMTESYKLCCINESPNTECNIKAQWPSNCERLISGRAPRFMIWFLMILGFTINFAMFVLTKCDKEKGTSFKLTVTNIAVGNILHCSYVIFIAIADTAYGDEYVENEIYGHGLIKRSRHTGI